MQLRVLWEEIMARYRQVEVVGEPVRVKPSFVKGFAELQVRLAPLVRSAHGGRGWDIEDHTSILVSALNVTHESYREHGSGVDAAGAGVLLSIELRLGD